MDQDPLAPSNANNSERKPRSPVDVSVISGKLFARHQFTLRWLGLKPAVWLIVLLDVYGIAATILALLGLFRPPIIIIPFVITPFLISQLRRLLTSLRYRLFLVASVGIFLFTTISLLYLALT